MKKARTYALTVELLQRYSAAALQNATELLEEASLLQTHGHKARAYFLAVASIEETGKAQLAFDAQGRRLRDSAVASKVRKSFEDHSSKITSAFTPWLLASSDVTKSAEAAIKLMVALKFGREPSMYTDVDETGESAQLPSVVVRSEASKDCVRLARDCLAHARRHIETSQPLLTTPAQDGFFAMKGAITRELLSTEDFWEFHIDRIKAGVNKLEESVVEYHKRHYQPKLKYKSDPDAAIDV